MNLSRARPSDELGEGSTTEVDAIISTKTKKMSTIMSASACFCRVALRELGREGVAHALHEDAAVVRLQSHSDDLITAIVGVSRDAEDEGLVMFRRKTKDGRV